MVLLLRVKVLEDKEKRRERDQENLLRICVKLCRARGRNNRVKASEEVKGMNQPCDHAILHVSDQERRRRGTN